VVEVKRVGRPALDDGVLRERKQLILAKALELVAQRGTANVRLRDVADTSKVSVGTLQHYFYSRDQLIREAFTQHAYEVIDDVLKAHSSTTAPWEALQIMFDDVFAAQDLERRCLLWVEFVAASRHDEKMRELAAEVWNAWRVPIRETVKRGVADGSFVPVLEVEFVVTSILALIDGGEIAVALQVEGISPSSLAVELKAAVGALLGVSTPALGKPSP
jgi:AcrR family transcriptional regulator